MLSARRNRYPFVVASLGCLAVALLAAGVAYYGIVLVQDVNAPVHRARWIACNVGFWTPLVGIVTAIVGMVVRRQRKWVCLIPLALNLLFFLAMFSVLRLIYRNPNALTAIGMKSTGGWMA
jgi:hypothetical protein